jgi:hypothetical protein
MGGWIIGSVTTPRRHASLPIAPRARGASTAQPPSSDGTPARLSPSSSAKPSSKPSPSSSASSASSWAAARNKNLTAETGPRWPAKRSAEPSKISAIFWSRGSELLHPLNSLLVRSLGEGHRPYRGGIANESDAERHLAHILSPNG